MAETHEPMNVNSVVSEHTLRLRGALGEMVKTPHGIGLLLGKTIEWNGLYFEDWKSEWNVWYGTDNAQSGWVWHQYRGSEIELIEAKGEENG